MSKQEITAEQAVNTLYALTRRAPLSADDHDVARRCAVMLLDEVATKKTASGPKKK